MTDMPDADYIAEVRASGQGKSEDYDRFTDAEILAWKKYYQGGGKFRNMYGDTVDKPDERGPNTPHNRNGTGDQGDFGWGWNNSGVGGEAPGGGGGFTGYGGGGMAKGGKTYGGAPAFAFKDFVPPSFQEAMSDPGYQFALQEGFRGIDQSAASRGALRTGGNLKDLMQYGQGLAAQQYGDVYNRAANTYGINLGTAKDIFAPQYGSWQTKYQADLQKYLQREGNIYGLLNPNIPSY